MRNICDVVDEMIKLIPKDESGLLGELYSLKQSSLYASPEAQSMWWRDFARIMNDYLPHPSVCNDWQKGVGSIFMDLK